MKMHLRLPAICDEDCYGQPCGLQIKDGLKVSISTLTGLLTVEGFEPCPRDHKYNSDSHAEAFQDTQRPAEIVSKHSSEQDTRPLRMSQT